MPREWRPPMDGSIACSIGGDMQHCCRTRSAGNGVATDRTLLAPSLVRRLLSSKAVSSAHNMYP